MIKAEHKLWAEFIFEKYLKSIFKKSFTALNLIGDVPEVNNNVQLIVVPNHSTWWDGFFVWYLNKLFFKRVFYLMMLESRLEKYRFFKKLGAFSLNKNSPKSILQTFNYINEILKSEERVLLNYYPQGELLPNFIRPININPGIEKIIQSYQRTLAILPMAIKIEFLGERLPFAFFNFANIIYSNQENCDFKKEIQISIENCLKTIDDNILNNNLGKVLFEGKKSPT